MKRTICILFFCWIASSAFAETTGNDVLNNCQTAVRFFDNNSAPANQHFDAGWCFGWIGAVLGMNQVTTEWTEYTKAKPSLFQFCLPTAGIPQIQAARIVIKYLKDHPEQLHENGVSLTIAALKNAFPCS